MKKKLILAAALFSFSVLGLTTGAREASAIPAFARQTGMACNSCHFQHFPSLNAFGRAFKAGGYTQVGGQSLIEGDFLSLPSVLNASFVLKTRYQKRNGSNETGDAGELNKGQLQFPDESALLIGGRAGEHVGFLLESSLKSGDPLFTSFKVPFTFNVSGTNLAAIPFTTDSAGPAYSFELLNTGALRMSRPFEHRTETSAQQYIGTDGNATGIGFVASNNLFFANFSLWSRDHATATDNDNSIAPGPFLNYVRVAVTPTFAGWDFGVGAQWWGGTSKNRDENAGEVRRHADAWAADAQAQGLVGNFPVGVYLTYGNAKKSDSAASTDANIYNSSTTDDKTAWTLAGEVGVIPNKLALGASYRGGKNGAATNDTDNATTLAATYTPTQNVEFQLNHSWYTGDGKPSAGTGDQLTTVMLFAAF